MSPQSTSLLDSTLSGLTNHQLERKTMAIQIELQLLEINLARNKPISDALV